MDDNDLLKIIEKWGRVVGVLAGVGAIMANATSNPGASYLLAIISWILVSVWLLTIWRQRSILHQALRIGGEHPKRIYTDIQRRGALALFISITVITWGWLGRQAMIRVLPRPVPKLNIFPADKYGIIVAEFTLGDLEREVYSGGADLRDKISADLDRLIAQHSLRSRVSVQKAGPIKNQEQAVALGERYGATLIIWGYVPVDQPGSFRPNFTIVSTTSRWQSTDPVLFGVEITDQGMLESSTLLAQHIRAVSSFLIGLVYLTDEQLKDYNVALALFREAIEITEQDLLSNAEMKHDLSFNLAVFYLMRGRAYAALGQEDKALADYDQALEYKPEFTRAYLAIGNIYYVHRDFETAKQFYQKAEHLWHGNYGLGLIAYHQGNFEEAVQYLNRAMQLFKSDGTLMGGTMDMNLRFTLGMAYKQSGKWEDAEALLWQVCHAENISSGFRNGACSELTAVPSSSISPTSKPTNTPLPSPTKALLTTEAAPRDRAVVTVNLAYLRYGPGSAFRAIMEVRNGDVLEIMGRNNEASWLVVSLPNGEEGWIRIEFVDLHHAAEALPVFSSPPTPTHAPSPTQKSTKKRTTEPTSTLLPTLPPYPPYPPTPPYP